jgi:hypothetical protein
LRRALNNSSSIVDKGVIFPLLCSNPLYACPKYANLRAMKRVEYLEGSVRRGAFLERDDEREGEGVGTRPGLEGRGTFKSALVSEEAGFAVSGRESAGDGRGEVVYDSSFRSSSVTREMRSSLLQFE